jgi:hypothetical protein
VNDFLKFYFRCTAPANDLDTRQHVPRRSQAHSEILVENFELGVLWDEYGLVGDIVVRILHFSCMHFKFPNCYLFSHSQTTFLEPISMSFFHLTYYTNLSKELSRTTSLRG